MIRCPKHARGTACLGQPPCRAVAGLSLSRTATPAQQATARIEARQTQFLRGQRQLNEVDTPGRCPEFAHAGWEGEEKTVSFPELGKFARKNTSHSRFLSTVRESLMPSLSVRLKSNEEHGVR